MSDPNRVGRITREQADRLHELVENVDVENAVVELLLPSQHVDLTLDEVRARLCTWVEAIGYSPDVVTDVMRYTSAHYDRIVLTFSDRDDITLDAAKIALPSFPWDNV